MATGANRVFFPQRALDEWLEQGRITLVGDELTITAESRRFRLATAVRFMAEVAENRDPHDLVGKVKTLEQVLALQGEHCADSVILGDNAYEVVEGFLGEPQPPPRRAASKRSMAAAKAARAALAEDDPLNHLLQQK